MRRTRARKVVADGKGSLQGAGFRSELGGSLVEYSLLVSLVAGVAVGAVTVMGGAATERFTVASDQIDGSGGIIPYGPDGAGGDQPGGPELPE